MTNYFSLGSKVFFFITFLTACLLSSGCGEKLPVLPPPTIDQQNVILVPVSKVIDGDTIKVQWNGTEQTIRLLLIDTPETHHPTLGVQPLGPEASAETHRLLDHKSVILELAVGQEKDHYGRYLAYAFVGNQSVEMDLLGKGLARVAYVIPPNTKYLTEFKQAESIAQKAQRGVWQTPGYARDDGFHPEVLAKGG
jgi:micrococcal nuclease